MKATTTVFGLALALSGSAQADMVMSGCAIQHKAGNGGNAFTIFWSGVPAASTSTICGHFDEDLTGITTSQKIQKLGDKCSTDNAGGMSTVVTLNKQSCLTQANAIIEAARKALGTGGTFDDTNTCNFAVSNC
ncbi:uncharacterized protein EKO05_0005565 [Ascochyta rabiei]|uniref:Uncharacterized protein n=1 Tax=Didymella rabiei TaxID=5454 RepID=A0A163KVP6_DIDRA|nr:uncharacterized protein EKO05_0005565 [Ascochyta rabiei]KZM27283.1 hypothetical protein ST47_g1567 [Ascochyta rabiei]UPX15106.1 hypothetical protein EKO05_0005565 [Ascochyta rabiei]